MSNPKPLPSHTLAADQYANLLRYIPSRNYFARIKVRGKLIRQSFTTAKTKLPDVLKAEKQLVATGEGQVSLTQAIKLYLERDEHDLSLKEKTRQ